MYDPGATFWSTSTHPIVEYTPTRPLFSSARIGASFSGPPLSLSQHVIVWLPPVLGDEVTLFWKSNVEVFVTVTGLMPTT